MDSLSKRTFTSKKTEKLRPLYAIYYYLNSKTNRDYNGAQYYFQPKLLVASSQLNNYYFIFTLTQMLVNFIILK